LVKLTPDLIVKILGQSSIDAKCPSCGNDHWLIPDEDHNFTVGLFNPREKDGGYVMPGAITPAIFLVCKDCGFIRLHSRILLESLIPKEKKEDEENGGGSDGKK
jgi:hypothetical protein